MIVIGCHNGSDEEPAMASPAVLSVRGRREGLRGGWGCAGRGGVMGIFARKPWRDDRGPGPRGIRRGRSVRATWLRTASSAYGGGLDVRALLAPGVFSGG